MCKTTKLANWMLRWPKITSQSLEITKCLCTCNDGKKISQFSPARHLVQSSHKETGFLHSFSDCFATYWNVAQCSNVEQWLTDDSMRHPPSWTYSTHFAINYQLQDWKIKSKLTSVRSVILLSLWWIGCPAVDSGGGCWWWWWWCCWTEAATAGGTAAAIGIVLVSPSFLS